MNPPDSLHIPRAMYGLWMALTTALALALTWFTASALGGTATTVGMAVGALGIGSLLTFAPAVMKVDREHWGVTVLFCGAARGLIALGAAYLMNQQRPDLAQRPLFLGVAAGAILILVVETVLAITILSRLERRREAMKSAAPSTPITATTDRA